MLATGLKQTRTTVGGILRNGKKHREEARVQHPALVYVMGDVTCTRCWQDLLQLSQWQAELARHGVGLYVVNNGRYQRPAAELAMRLGMPVTFVTDAGAGPGSGQIEPLTYGCLQLVDRRGELLYQRTLGHEIHSLEPEVWLPLLSHLN